MEIVCRTALLNEVKVVEGANVVASLHYIVKKNKAGFKLGTFPDWTLNGAPLISQNLTKERKIEVVRRLLAQLPRNTSLNFVCRHASADAELLETAFKAAGFVHTMGVTYSQPCSAESVISRVSRKHARRIILADRSLNVVEIGADRFITFYEANLKAAGKSSYSHLGTARDLIAAGCQRNPPQVRVIAARQRSGRREDGSFDASSKDDMLDAAIACAWDNERYYLWMITRRGDGDPAGKAHPDAGKLLVVKAMEHARRLGLVFDAGGGSGWFYEKILKLPDAEICDEYERTTRMAGLAKIFPSLGTAAWLIYSRTSKVKELLRIRRKEHDGSQQDRTALSRSS